MKVHFYLYFFAVFFFSITFIASISNIIREDEYNIMRRTIAIIALALAGICYIIIRLRGR